MYSCTIITLSDRAYNNVYEDKSGKYLIEAIKNNFELKNYHLIKDDAKELETILKNEVNNVDLIITTGGTGLSSRDITVDVVEKLMDYEVRGVTTAIHNCSLNASSGAMFSRALGCVIEKTLVITLPGSLKAVTELSELLLSHLEHGLNHLHDVRVHK